MKTLILGGDGYLGWPMALSCSRKYDDVVVVDNYQKRRLLSELGMAPLNATELLPERAELWRKLTGLGIEVAIGDLCDWDFTKKLFERVKPDVVVHFAEQPSAPFSMMNQSSALLTLRNNLEGTANIIHAIHATVPDAHIVKIGTMGEYGTPNIRIEEGWIDISHKGRSDRFLYPRQAGSLYHTTKIMDTDMLWLYCRIWGLRVTDLMQGPVYGIYTEETQEDPDLLPMFTYDYVFGTVLNRFLTQLVAGIPLTIYGKGKQKRGYINIRDTIRCVRFAIENPPAAGEMRIFNQFSEIFSVNSLAEKVLEAGEAIGLSGEVQNIPNPRFELEEHFYEVENSGLRDLGWTPCLLTDEVIKRLLLWIRDNKFDINNDHATVGNH